MEDTYINVTGQDFDEKILQAPNMALVHFSSEQVSLCGIQDVELAVVSKDYQGRVTFAKLNTDDNPEVTQQWNIEGVPTLIFFKSGRELHRIKGIMMRDRLRRQIEGVMLAN